MQADKFFESDTLLPTHVGADLAVCAAADLYGLRATATPLPGEYDDNFLLTSDAGDRFVLKIMHPSRELSFVEMQCRALQHIADRAPSLPMPRVIPARTSAAIGEIKGETGERRFVWMLSYVAGRPFAETRPHTSELRQQVGSLIGGMTIALAGFDHSGAHREFKWVLTRASWISEFLEHVQDPRRRQIVEAFLTRYRGEVLPVLPRLRQSVIHGDANDYNVLTNTRRACAPTVTAVIDFGDLHYGATVCELAIATAYMLLDEEDPLSAAADVVAGFHRIFPLTEQEIGLIFPLIAIRLCVSVVNSAYRKTLANDPYITISEGPAWEALEKLARIPSRLPTYLFRNACGLPSVPNEAPVVDWLQSRGTHFEPLIEELSSAQVIDLGIGSLLSGADPSNVDALFTGSRVMIGRYGEARGVYTAPEFTVANNPTAEARTIHLGLDIFCASGTAVHAPVDGIVHAFANNHRPQDYGPVIILRHEARDGRQFFTLYGHLNVESLQGLHVGRPIRRGERVGRVGERTVNGGWPPHLHFQIITDLLDLGTDFPGVARASQWGVWSRLSPDPNLIVGIPAASFPPRELTAEQTLQARKLCLGANLSISYRKPLKIVRGWKQYLYDHTGRAYLDTYNNVPLVGHTHPRVVQAAQRQLALLNTNTRYLHDNVVRYAESLTALMPEPLRVCYFLNSASEANELAIRMARAHTRRYDMLVLEHAYHGHTNTLVDISPYKFDGPGGSGRKPWVHVAPIPDTYRGPFKRPDREAGARYAAQVRDLLASGIQPAAFIAESLPSVAGQIVFPPGYLREVYRVVRAAGGVCIADEVQVGFGRLGSHFWGFETQEVVPDIVVLGKPIGNGFPLAALITTGEIAASFDNGMEFFSTFGGNPVACAAGLAVLDVLKDEALPQNASRIGGYLKNRLNQLIEKHSLVGDIRGMGLFLGVELVRDRASLEPADEEAIYVVDRLREYGILTGTDGPHHNVIKIRPPLCFCEADADLLASTLDSVLSEDALRIVWCGRT